MVRTEVLRRVGDSEADKQHMEAVWSCSSEMETRPHADTVTHRTGDPLDAGIPGQRGWFGFIILDCWLLFIIDFKFLQ